ncbi:adenosylmethionine--8-amino-7-oxononanoate transaminase [Vibrio alginolyticus]|jgi:adenosylmethionine-8-amino-7-oxononanoate aminotransferase|uniref:adenosylmethionine--8-amino-7-oxononanoate transaminase n=1 Tax=Vibrio TaxID=662 RepID=UPI001EC2720D|nr:MULTISPECIES: adenosylmethionine--8-amino-7-oxononanoate transaminase [Vibrio]EGR0718946.1 adenosylmethionine--8-amino-7-oxononanoate transaminase [Vibrio alginolyticus]EIO9262011.1 adenosylmethionine--8-amino-7-oxononanoate transaminase [Vibrio alginolyticus]EJE3286271.1 adenosylmethionine--8-amino-7-oxononanoate transaminase [Vibrio alginolyticus]EJN3356730.1 adenosylmethionine--8-amino-7-oxononanoate transaminase [Vibrio alginolyticus]EJS0369897.1 adenosylmethionine--8-amino-7-oxononanoa
MDLAFDRQHIWHPYTSTLTPLTCYPVASANGVHIKLEDGTELVDGMSSWWSTIHGYNHPYLNQAAHKQIDQVSHVMFGGITHQPAISLCKKLLSLAPSNLEHVFLADSGSVAVEVSLKMALQYWHAKGERRPKFLTLRHGYHGDTFAAMSVTDPDNSMHSLYKGFLPEHIFAESPTCGYWDEWKPEDLTDFEHKIETHHQELTAVILEPIVQGAGGMRIYHPEFLKGVRRLCDKYGLLLIADEIATGFGRTGKLFACEHADIQPDILCVGKALTGGYMTLSATLASKHVADTVCGGDAGCFMHGPTFMGNPLACAVATASLELIEQGNWQQQTQQIETLFSELLPKLEEYELVKNTRWLGAIGVVETHRPVNMETIQALFVEHGVWIRPFGKLIYMMPPFISKPEDIEKLVDAIDAALQRKDCFAS